MIFTYPWKNKSDSHFSNDTGEPCWNGSQIRNTTSWISQCNKLSGGLKSLNKTVRLLEAPSLEKRGQYKKDSEK